MVKQYTKVIFSTIIMLAACLLFSCKGGSQQEHLQAQVDSLSAVSGVQADSLAYYASVINEISVGLDSITEYENILFNNAKGMEGKPLTRHEIREKLNALAELLERQRSKIASLEDSLMKRGEGFAKMGNVISFLDRQLEEKNQTIITLRSELEQRNVSIQRMHQQIGTLTKTAEQLQSTVQEQEQVLVTQSDLFNHCYVKIGTKKELQQAGLLTKNGLFSKSKLDVSRVNPSQFMTVDIRLFTEITIPSKKVKVLSQMPAGSYRLTNNGNNTVTLSITDPSAFWSVSNYLIIQTN